MLRLSVVDVSAESRSRLAREISTFQESGNPELSLLPPVSVHQYAPEEIKFHAAPDVCLIGQELISSDISAVGRIRKLLPDTPILVRIAASSDTLVLIEDLARLGADDVVTDKTDPRDFFKKVIMLCRRPKKGKGGNLVVVDSAKGGLGVTSLSAALAEVATMNGKKVAFIDFDLETQDASRFLQSRPYLNENLQMLLEKARPVTEESVKQCLTSVWEEDHGLFVMPPAPLHDESLDFSSEKARIYLSIFEVLDQLFDVVIVDVGCARGSLLKTLYRIADKVIILVGNDPACLYATVSKIGNIRPLLAPTANLYFIENSPTRYGLPKNVLVNEINIATKSSESNWISTSTPFCKLASRWPGSGDTMLSRGGRGIVKAITSAASTIGIIGDTVAQDSVTQSEWAIFDTISAKFKNRLPGSNAEGVQLIGRSGQKDGVKLLPFRGKRAKTAPQPEDPTLNKTDSITSTQEMFDSLVEKSVPSVSKKVEHTDQVEDLLEVDIDSLIKKANVV